MHQNGEGEDGAHAKVVVSGHGGEGSKRKKGGGSKSSPRGPRPACSAAVGCSISCHIPEVDLGASRSGRGAVEAAREGRGGGAEAAREGRRGGGAGGAEEM